MLKGFLEKYINNAKNILDNIDYSKIEEIIEQIEKADKIYILGNGGSSATASHIKNDLGVGLARRGIKHFNIENLTDNIPTITAISNDIAYEDIFYLQLLNRVKKGDLIIAISCSGNSKNILKGVEYSKDIGAKIVSLVGFDGGRLKDLSDICLHTKTQNGEYGVVEDIHLIINHIIFSYYIKEKNE